MRNYLLHLNFLIVTAGTLGSLYFSEILKYPPCPLCWYQRICLYPLVLIFGVALWRGAKDYKKYALPLALLGLLISVYHNLLYFGVIPQEISACTQELSCTARQLELFGFITIPLLSMVGFTLTTALIFFDKENQ